MDGRQKRIVVVLMVLTIIFTISGGTLAYWTWTSGESDKTTVTFTATKDFSCAADGGGNITNGDVNLAPTNCSFDAWMYNEHPDNTVLTRYIKVTPTILREGLSINMDLWLNINSIGTGLSNSKNFRWELTKPTGESPDDIVCGYNVVASGTFNGAKAGDKILLLDKELYNSSEPQNYYLHIWLDAAETSASTMNQSFNFSLGGECDDEALPQAYAVYSEDDYSLRFYKTADTITVGSRYNDLVVTEVYTGFENSTMPWWGNEWLGLPEIYTVKFEDEITPKSTAQWFEGMEWISTLDLTNLNTSKVTDMSRMFANSRFESGNIVITGLENLDTSNVTNMSEMFAYIGGEDFIIDLSNWDVSKVEDMSYMFDNAASWANTWDVDVTDWDTSNVTNMSNMFQFAGYESPHFSISGIENWNTSQVTNMSYMFFETATNWTDVDEVGYLFDLSGWDVYSTLLHDDFSSNSSIIEPNWVN